ncbi:MAG: VanZ family protein [Desulfoprunum sp.]|nr:VanZ family protein [Desulfoprunum sp.]
MIRLTPAVKRFLPPAVVMVTIFVLSHQPGENLPLPALPGIDKVAHLVVYGLLAATLIRAFAQRMRQLRPGPVVMLTVLWCLVYGITDEFHQSFIPGRSVSGLDVLADTVGALLVGVAWLFLRRPVIADDIKKQCSS